MKGILLLFATLIPLWGFSNGGTIDYSHFRKTGNIRLLRKADISLLKENLQIKVIGDYTEIEVEYLLKNNGPKQKIQYGFPVDAYENDWHFGDPPSDIFDFVENFRMSEENTNIKSSQWIVDKAYLAESVNLYMGHLGPPRKYTILRKWYAATIGFEKGETKTLKVFYKIINTKLDILPGFASIHQYSDRHFTYHLTPSSNWGDGIVKNFNLTIDLSDLHSIGAISKISGIDGLVEANNIYSLKAIDYDLKKSNRIEINYNINDFKLAGFIEKTRLPGNVIKSVSASSNSSAAKNLIDNLVQTSWTGKQGDWIEFTFNKVKHKIYNEFISPHGILVLNGDYSSEEKFNNSGKIKSAKVIINDKVYNIEPWEEKGSTIIPMGKPIYKKVNPVNISGLATILAEDFGSVEKLRIEILKVEGKSKEVTLSEIYLVQ